jgi:hypothetical protein
LREDIIETKDLVNIGSDLIEEKAIIEIKAQINSSPNDTSLKRCSIFNINSLYIQYNI